MHAARGIVVGLMLALAPVASADDHYGEQIALADAASIGVFFAATRFADDTERDLAIAAGVGTSAFVLFAPAVHLVHRHADQAAISLGLRLIPATALLTIGHCDGGEQAIGCIAGHLMIAVLGGLAVSAVDIFALSDHQHAMPMMLGGRF